MAPFLQPRVQQSGPGHGQDDLRTPQDQHDDHQPQVSPHTPCFCLITGGMMRSVTQHYLRTTHHGFHNLLWPHFSASESTNWTPRLAKRSARHSRSTRRLPTSSKPACALVLSHYNYGGGMMRFVTHHYLRTTHHGFHNLLWPHFSASGATIWVLRAARRSARHWKSTRRSPTSSKAVFASLWGG